MNWSLPLAEQSGPAGRRAAPLFSALTLVALVLPMNAGCSALPVMQSAPVQVAMLDGKARINEYSDVEKLRLSQIPRTPDFDLPTGVIPATHQIASVGPGAKTPSPPQPALSAFRFRTPPQKVSSQKLALPAKQLLGPDKKASRQLMRNPPCSCQCSASMHPNRLRGRRLGKPAVRDHFKL